MRRNDFSRESRCFMNRRSLCDPRPPVKYRIWSAATRPVLYTDIVDLGRTQNALESRARSGGARFWKSRSAVSGTTPVSRCGSLGGPAYCAPGLQKRAPLLRSAAL